MGGGIQCHHSSSFYLAHPFLLLFCLSLFSFQQGVVTAVKTVTNGANGNGTGADESPLSEEVSYIISLVSDTVQSNYRDNTP